MLSVAVAALACLCLARTSPAEPYSLRMYSQKTHNIKDITSILSSIEERLKVLDIVSAAQEKHARRLDEIQDKLDRVETTLTLKLERAQLAAERLEHRLHMLQTNVQTSIKESSSKIERSQGKIEELTQNLTSNINTHKTLLEKVNGAYADTWHRGLMLESLMRDGLSLVNVTRRELADGLRALARRQRDARLTSADLEANFARRLSDNTYKIDLKMQEVMDTQKRFVDSCQRVQQDDPNQVANVLDKLFDSLINKIAIIFSELQTIKETVRKHDRTVIKVLNTPQIDATCHRLESAFRNNTHGIFKENELKQLTEKFVALTDRADASLQRLEAKIGEDSDIPMPSSEVTLAADRLLRQLQETKGDKASDEDLDYDVDDEIDFFEDSKSDMMDEDKQILNKASERDTTSKASTSTRPTHRRHLHKHPYDRGPTWRKSLE